MGTIDYQAFWEAGARWDEYLNHSVKENAELWQGIYRTARVPPEILEQLHTLGDPWRLLVLSEDWCGDASNTVPVVARLAEAAPGVSMRVLQRDQVPLLMDRYLTDGSRSIPIVILLDSDWEAVGHWGPRPAELQRWVSAEKREGVRPPEEIYKDVRKWYARDRGKSTLSEILTVMADAKAKAGTPVL